MKKTLFFLALFSSIFAKAQDTTKTPILIKASNPTQLYTFVEINSGIDFGHGPDFFEPEIWEFGLRGNFAINKFRFGVFVPITNASASAQGDIVLDMGYQIHNNEKGFYRSTLINAGVSFPSNEDMPLEYNRYSASNKYKTFINYTGSIHISNKFELYPYLEYKYQQSFSSGYTIDGLNSKVYDNVWGVGITANYAINKVSFIQFGAKYQHIKSITESSYKPLNGTENIQFLNLFLHYQYALNPKSHLYFRLEDNILLNKIDYKRSQISKGLLGFRFGFKYFLD